MNRHRRQQTDNTVKAHNARRLETLGLILIALLILAITVTRSWHYINWGAR